MPANLVRRHLLLLFARPRPYTTVSLGGLGVLAAMCQAHGLDGECDALLDASRPLAASVHLLGEDGDESLDPATLIEVGHALTAFSGRPPRLVSTAVRSEDLAAAVVDAIDALGWEEFAPHLASWSANGDAATTGVELDEQGALDRAELIRSLAVRVAVYREAFIADPGAWQLAPVVLSPRTLRQAGQLLGISLDGRPFSTAVLPRTARYANRVGRIVAAAAMAKLGPALTAVAPVEPVADALAVLAVVAEAVATPSRGESRHLTVRSESAAPAQAAWVPGVWWPVIDAWGSTSSRTRAAAPVSTAWRLPPVEADVIVWMIMWAASAIGTVASTPRHGDVDWREHVRSTWDPVWGMAMASGWDVMQSARSLPLRSPFPSPMGGTEMSAVSWDDPVTLPWVGPGAVRKVS